MAYPTGTSWKPIDAPLGSQPIAETSTTQRHALGTIVRAVDTTYGDGEFIYLAGVASTTAGDVVIYNSKTGATVRAVTGGTTTGPAAVAMSANLASAYGWYCVSGSVPVAAATALVDTYAHLSATPGTIDDAVSATERIDGMLIKAATSGGFATCQLTRPSISGLGGTTGSNTGDVSLAAVGSTPAATGASLSGQVLTLQPASVTHPGVVSNTTQTFLGDKTITGTLTVTSTLGASNFSGTHSGTNTGDLTVTTIGSSANANGMTLTGQALNLEPASASFGGIVTTGTQTFAGAKTFNSAVTLGISYAQPTSVSGATGVTSLYTGRPTRGRTKVRIAKEAWVDAAVTQDITLITFQAKTRIVAIYCDTTTAFAGLAGTIELQVGTSAGGSELILAHDVKTATVTKGLLDADLGASMVRAAVVQGAYLPSWTGTGSIYVRLTSGTGNIGTGAATNLTNGQADIDVIFERMD